MKFNKFSSIYIDEKYRLEFFLSIQYFPLKMKEELLNKEETCEVVKAIIRVYPSLKTELAYKNHFELLCAVVLSAQTTDAGVNKVTPLLFAEFPTPYSMMNADVKNIENCIKSIGLYKNKAKYLKSLSKMLVEKFDGTVPDTREKLMSLDGVGRKTANVVLANAFGIPSFAVDTHVNRLCKILKFVESSYDVLELEKMMMRKLPTDLWIASHHALVLFGRYNCTARKHDHNLCLSLIKENLSGNQVAENALIKLQPKS